MPEDFKDTRFRNAGAPECADVVDATINTTNEGLDAFEDRRITFTEIAFKTMKLFDDWRAAGKDIHLVDDEIKMIGWDTAVHYAVMDIDEGLVFPSSMAKAEHKVKAGTDLAQALIAFYFAMVSEE